jgi:hypothetical protein
MLEAAIRVDSKRVLEKLTLGVKQHKWLAGLGIDQALLDEATRIVAPTRECGGGERLSHVHLAAS